MGDHAVLIPTPLGPLGGVVSERDGERRGAVILLQGAGRPARSGVNSFWARTARALAERGVVVLRFDYAGEGESLQAGDGDAPASVDIGDGSRGRAGLHLYLLAQAVAWFRAQLDGLDPLLAGSCQGARMAIEHNGGDGMAASPSLLIAPYLRTLTSTPSRPAGRPGWRRRIRGSVTQTDPIDPLVVSCMKTALERAPAWILVGDQDEPDISLLLDRLGPTAHQLTLEVVPNAALHLLDQPDIQEEAHRRLLAEVDRRLGSAMPHSG